MNVVFPQIDPQWIFDRDCVVFPAIVDGRAVKCLVTMEALIQNFGAQGRSDEDFLRAFVENRKRIEESRERRSNQASSIPEGRQWKCSFSRKNRPR